MSYFDSQLGQRPPVPPEAPAQPAPSADGAKDPRLFAAGLGACPRETAGGSLAQVGADHARESFQPSRVGSRQPIIGGEAPLATAGREPQPVACPLCQAPLPGPDAHGVRECVGRCGARWLADSAGRLLDIAALPFGICACCRPAQALARAEVGAICPASGQEYLLLPGGAVPRAQAAPEGLCACCAPPAPLLRQGDDLVCSARPAQRYELRGGVPVPLAHTAGAAATLAAIDAALRKNSARVGINGLFDLDPRV